jgi:putative phosphoesterase
MRLGVVSDTHSAGSGRDLPSEVLREFEGVDVILHCGDLECIGVLDVLEEVAPVLAVRGYEDPREPSDRLADVTRIVNSGLVNIGMVHDIQWPIIGIRTNGDGTELEFPDTDVTALLKKRFGESVQIVVFGDTHEELICWYQDILFFNPGSPTYPGRRHKHGSLGTVGFLEINDMIIEPRIVQLGRQQ